MEEAKKQSKDRPKYCILLSHLSQRKTFLRMLFAVYCNGAYKSNSSDPPLSPETFSRHTGYWKAWVLLMCLTAPANPGTSSGRAVRQTLCYIILMGYFRAQQRVLERAVPAQKALVQRGYHRPPTLSPKTERKQMQQHLLVWTSPAEVAAWTTHKMAPANPSQLCSRVRR